MSANKLRYELDKKDKSLTSRILDFFFQNPEAFVSTMLVGNCMALVVYGLQVAGGATVVCLNADLFVGYVLVAFCGCISSADCISVKP